MSEEFIEKPPTRSKAPLLMAALLVVLAIGGSVYWLNGSPNNGTGDDVERGKAQAGGAHDDADTSVEHSTALGTNAFQLSEDAFDSDDEDADAEGQESNNADTPQPKDRWSCSGIIKGSEAMKVVRSERRAVQTCYESQLKVNNTLQGTLIAKLRINATGQVSGVKMEGDLRDRKVRQCVSQIARGWRFPNPENGICAVLKAPFHLAPRL